MPKVINIRDTRYKVPEGAVYVGRANPRYQLPASKWGNPWRIGGRCPDDGHRLTREEVIEIYRNSLSQMLTAKRDDGTVILDLAELKGKDLICWCHNWNGQGDNPMYCHADILLELANK